MIESGSANHPESGNHAGRPVGCGVDITCLIDRSCGIESGGVAVVGFSMVG
jgi:hypothetical protein